MRVSIQTEALGEIRPGGDNSTLYPKSAEYDQSFIRPEAILTATQFDVIAIDIRRFVIDNATNITVMFVKNRSVPSQRSRRFV